MRNKITDLNNHLFAQLERLGDEDLDHDELKIEIDRSKAMVGIAGQLVESAKVSVEAMSLLQKSGADITGFGQGLLGKPKSDQS